MAQEPSSCKAAAEIVGVAVDHVRPIGVLQNCISRPFLPFSLPSILLISTSSSSSSKLEANSFGSAFSCPRPQPEPLRSLPPSISIRCSFASSHFCRSLPTLSCRRRRCSRILGVTEQEEEASAARQQEGEVTSPARGAPRHHRATTAFLLSSPLYLYLPSNSCGNE